MFDLFIFNLSENYDDTQNIKSEPTKSYFLIELFLTEDNRIYCLFNFQ